MAKSERSNFAAEADELSLAAATPTAGDDPEPDTLDVRDDSLMVMHGTLQRLRQPAVAIAIGLAVSLAALAIAGVLTRAGHGVDPA